MSETYSKKQILSFLKFHEDLPRYETTIFNFDKFATQLANVVTDPYTPTPYAIGLHGEWGSGKTSLIGQVLLNVQKEFENDENKKVIWFDAWKYERLDPAAALLQRISIQFNKNSNFKRAIKGLVYTFSDVALRAKTGLSLKQVIENFESSVKEIPTIIDQLEKMLENRRLVVFIDDLDRCLVENSLRVLEAIKLFLNAKGMIFVIAVDMKKLERAWALRYNESPSAIQEGKDHVEKIFQLRLTLPPKEQQQIESYVKDLASTLPDKIRDLVVNGCPRNPRKIKRILNLIFFLSKELKEEEFNSLFPLIVIWCIITSSYPWLAEIIKREPNSLVQMGLASANYTFDAFKRLGSTFQEVRNQRNNLTVMGKGMISWPKVYRSTLDGLEQIIEKNDIDVLNFLQEFRKFYDLQINQGTNEEMMTQKLEQFKRDIGDDLSVVIYRAGLIG